MTRTNARPMASAKKNQAHSTFALSVDEGGNAFLSDEDVTRLTGYRHSKKVIGALDDLSIPYILNARGKPLVLRSSVDLGAADRARQRPGKPRKEWRPL